MDKKNHSFPKIALLLIILAVSLLLLYRNALLFMVRQWSSLDMYSHGFFIPLISAYLVWTKRKELSALKPSPSYVLGYVILICGLLMFLFGEVGGIIVLQSLSILPAIAGLIIVVLGLSFMKLLIIPVGYLIFMIPIWEMVTYRLHPPFQHFSASMGGRILKLLEIPVHVNENTLQLPNIAFHVVKECSGVNYLISIIAIGIPMAFLFLNSTKRKLILIISAIVIAIFVNGLRVALIGIIAHAGISNNSHGPFHILQGVLVSLIGYGVLFGGLWILRQSRPETSKIVIELEKKEGTCKSPFFINKMFYPAVSVIILFIAVESYSHFRIPMPTPLKQSLSQFPIQIDGWEGRDGFSSRGKYDFPGVDVELNRTYRKGSDAIDLYIGYFKYQEQGKELICHKTKELHSNASKVNINKNPHGVIKINEAVIQEQVNQKLIFFWYDINGRVVTGRVMGKLCTIWDALIKGRTNGAVIMIKTDIRPGENFFDKSKMIQTFAEKTYPLLKNYLAES